MKTINKELMTKVVGGVTARTCMLLGWSTIGYAASGSHVELMASENLYSSFWNDLVMK